VVGLAVFVLALAAIVERKEWEEWLSAVLGPWALVPPWALGFANVATARWTHVGVGLAVAVLAALELWLIRQGPTAKAA
jgi:hypothetical protein